MITIESINHEELSAYLLKKGWIKIPSNKASLDIFQEPIDNSPFEILLPNKKGLAGYYDNMKDAIKILSIIENRNPSLIIKSVLSIDKDLHYYKVKSSSSESISINLLYRLISSTRFMLKEASRYEHTKIYQNLPTEKRKSINRPRDESSKFINDCKFAHTWKGSFGITIEAPLWLPSLGLFEEIPETLGRKATKRILNGYKIISDAVEHNSYNFIIDNIEKEDEILMFGHLPEIKDYLKRGEIDIEVAMSPTIKVEKNFLDISKPIINQKMLNYIESAVDQIKEPSPEKEIEILGFPETISATKQDLLQDLVESDRRVIVKGISRQIDQASLKMELSLEDYRKAIRAQDEIRNVKVRCKVKKKIRGWEVTEVISFDLID